MIKVNPESTDISGIFDEEEQIRAFSPEAANRRTELKITSIAANSPAEKMKFVMDTHVSIGALERYICKQ